jgi:hypothetical protein
MGPCGRERVASSFSFFGFDGDVLASIEIVVWLGTRDARPQRPSLPRPTTTRMNDNPSERQRSGIRRWRWRNAKRSPATARHLSRRHRRIEAESGISGTSGSAP